MRRIRDRLVQDLAASIAKAYRIDPQAAAEQIVLMVEADSALQRALREKPDIEEIRRLRIFKEIEKRARKGIYNHLRRYKRDDDRLARALTLLEGIGCGERPAEAEQAMRTICGEHVSTAERLGAMASFQAMLASRAGEATSILDVGAGVVPLIFPFAACPRLQHYLAIDRDQSAMRAVRACARWRGDVTLNALDWAISDGWGPVVEAGRSEFDLALLFKIVPVIARQQPRLLALLARTPAKRLLITGSKGALAKRQVIAHREQRTLMSFIEDFGLTIEDRFETMDEIGFCISR